MDLATLKQRVIEGDREAATALTRQAIDAEWAPTVLLNEALFPAMERVGRLMQEHEYFLPEVLLAARAMQACIALLRPFLGDDPGAKPIGTVVACTVAGDMHDIGKNLVCMMLEGAGFAVVDLGSNCQAERVVDAVGERRPNLVVMSAMLTTTMLQMGRVVEALRSAGLRDGVHVMVGGAPVSAKFAREIGADFYGHHAATAAAHARRFMEARRARRPARQPGSISMADWFGSRMVQLTHGFLRGGARTYCVGTAVS